MTYRWMVILCLAGLFLAGCGTTQDRFSDKDQDMADHIAMRLDTDPDLGSQRVAISVDNGIATVSGVFSNASSRLRAMSVIRGTPGVLAVIDRSSLR